MSPLTQPLRHHRLQVDHDDRAQRGESLCRGSPQRGQGGDQCCHRSCPRGGIRGLAIRLEAATAKLAELEEEHGGEEGAFSELDKVNQANVAKRLKEIKGDTEAKAEAEALEARLEANAKEGDRKKRVKEAEASLDDKAYAQYPKLGEADVKALVVDDKWMAALESTVHGETDRIS